MLKRLAVSFLILSSLLGGQAMSAERPTRLAFVDTGNTGRSVTAEALAVAIAAKEGLAVQVISRAVALNPYNIHPEENFVTLLAERGIDVKSHVAAGFGAPEAKFSDVILTMTAAHRDFILTNFPETKGHVFTLSEYATGTNSEVLDAFGKPMDFYKTVLAQLDGLIGAAVRKAAAEKH